MSWRVGAWGATVSAVALAAGGLGLLASGEPTSFPVATMTDTSIDPMIDATTTSTTSTTAPAVVSLLPASVEASTRIVGPQGTVTFTVECPPIDGVSAGPVHVRVVSLGTDAVEVVETGVTGSGSFDWPAPDRPRVTGSYRFEVWCGDPSDEPYPDDLAITVDIVDVIDPPRPPTTTTTTMTPTTTVPDVEQNPPVPGPVALPETG